MALYSLENTCIKQTPFCQTQLLAKDLPTWLREKEANLNLTPIALIWHFCALHRRLIAIPI